MIKKISQYALSFLGFLLSLVSMFLLGKREGKHQRDLEESEREKALIKRGRKIEEEVRNEFEKVETPEEALRMYRKRTGSYTR